METIRHFSHSKHPLILKNKLGEKEEEFVCDGCQRPISDQKDGYYACEEGSSESCNFYLHKKCADLPRQINLPVHEHPLTLFARPPYDSLCCFCNICQGMKWKWFTYQCSLCDFDVDMICASLLLEEKELGNNILQHEGHPQHPLSLQRRASLFTCDACGTEHKDLSYICTTCQFWIHKSCASFPKSITVAHHDDPLFLAYSLPPKYRNFTQFCDICHQKVHPTTWMYYCDNCRYFSHLKCATATSNTPSLTAGETETQLAEEGDTESSQVIQFPMPNHKSLHPTSQFVANNNTSGAYDHNGEMELRHRLHDHPLSVHNDGERTMNNLAHSEIICDGCVRPISVPFYGCSLCNFFLHRFCAELPEELKCPREPGHSMEVLCRYSYNYFECSFCFRNCNGFACRCESCNLTLDIGCASYLLPGRIKHDSHRHPLVRRHLSTGDHDVECNSCSYELTGVTNIFSCKACSFNLCTMCLDFPLSVRHEYDSHLIPLTYPPIKDHPSDFICEICEKDINPRYWIYHCRDCNQSFHKWCVSPIDQFLNVKFGGTVNFDNIHQHHLTFVRNSKSKYESRCNQCGSDWNGFPILECAPCRFKLCIPCARRNR